MTLLAGDCIDRMRELPEGSVDAVVTDPPYGIGFMGREWDSFAPAAIARRAEQVRRKGTTRQSEPWPEKVGEGSQGGGVAIVYDESARGNRAFQEWCQAWAGECLRILKPGGHLVSFSGTRTYHRLAAGVEDAGFDIRDQLAWLFGSGFPKSRNLDGDWKGWGTNLKPGYEPILLARKPLSGTILANVAAHGVGAINVDACRIETEEGANLDGGRVSSKTEGWDRPWKHDEQAVADARNRGDEAVARAEALGRWPSNVLLDPSAAAMLDEQTGELRSGANPTRRGSDKFRDVYGAFPGQEECEPARGADAGGASRFYYCPKPDKAERHAGLAVPSLFAGDAPERNDHPTVKPIDLMRWLCRLVTSPAGVVFDPFLGSGTTGIAAALEGFSFIGVEREPHYLSIAAARIAHWAGKPTELVA